MGFQSLVNPHHCDLTMIYMSERLRVYFCISRKLSRLKFHCGNLIHTLLTCKFGHILIDQYVHVYINIS